MEDESAKSIKRSDYVSPAQGSHDLEVTCSDGTVAVSLQLWMLHCSFFQGKRSFEALAETRTNDTNETDANDEGHASKRRKTSHSLDLSDGPSFTMSTVIAFDQSICLVDLSPNKRLFRMVKLADYLMAPWVRRNFVRQLARSLPSLHVKYNTVRHSVSQRKFYLKIGPGVVDIVHGDACSLTAEEKQMLIPFYLYFCGKFSDIYIQKESMDWSLPPLPQPLRDCAWKHLAGPDLPHKHCPSFFHLVRMAGLPSDPNLLEEFALRSQQPQPNNAGMFQLAYILRDLPRYIEESGVDIATWHSTMKPYSDFQQFFGC